MSSDILGVTTNEVANTRISRVLAPVFGASIRSRNFIGNKLGNLRCLGGNQGGYVKMLNHIAALQAHAATYGADAVVRMRFDSGEFNPEENQSMSKTTAYGTATLDALQ